jgi:hypothetical protein
MQETYPRNRIWGQDYRSSGIGFLWAQIELGEQGNDGEKMKNVSITSRVAQRASFRSILPIRNMYPTRDRPASAVSPSIMTLSFQLLQVPKMRGPHTLRRAPARVDVPSSSATSSLHYIRAHSSLDATDSLYSELVRDGRDPSRPCPAIR